MLDILDTVDWSKLYHCYGPATDMPNMLRNLVNATSDDDFSKTYSKLIDAIAHQGSIYSATPHATEFIIQIMKQSKNTKRKVEHLVVISELLRSTLLVSRHVVYVRYELELYDTISSHLDDFLALLKNESAEIQTASAYVLSFLTDKHHQILPTLVDCVEQTEDTWLQSVAINAYAKLVLHTEYPRKNIHRTSSDMG